VAVHACPRCGTPDRARGARFVDRIGPVVAEVLA
jgi:hypothetical protein